jgi:Transposase DDE domain
MSNGKNKKQYFPPDIDRDHARPRHAPAPSNAAVEDRLSELISPATYALSEHYRRLGLRWRILSLPVMVAAILAMIWRQVPSVSTLAQMIAREPLLWASPHRVTQQALSLRLRSLPAALFADLFASLLPLLFTRAATRRRPQPAVVERALRHFERLWLLDATTLEALFHKVGLLRDEPKTTFGGKLLALLDLPSKLPVQLWLDENATANEKSFLDERVKARLKAGTLLIFDLGFYAFPFFDWLTEEGLAFVTRARAASAYRSNEVLLETALVRDRIITLGVYRSNPCQHPVRLVEVCVGGTWRAYLTNVLDPSTLSTADVIDLYGRRWQVEDAFLMVKRLLGLSYLWTGAFNGIAMQAWATWLLYAMLLDLSDAVAEELGLPLDQISVEMVYRGLYHFTVAYQQGKASDPVAYLSTQTDLGIVKRRRKHRERAKLDKRPPELNL